MVFEPTAEQIVFRLILPFALGVLTGLGVIWIRRRR